LKKVATAFKAMVTELMRLDPRVVATIKPGVVARRMAIEPRNPPRLVWAMCPSFFVD
jgi:hypothetical protein